MLTIAFAVGCGAVSNQGGSRVRVQGCEVIVDDVIGRMPPTRGGPRARGELGTGIECNVWTFE